MISNNEKNVLFVTSLLRAREIKMAKALRSIGWTVILVYSKNTPFDPDAYFDLAIATESTDEIHGVAKSLRPRISHVFSGAVDDVVELFCADKPGPVVIDMNDVFAPSLFDYCEERFEPTRKCLEQADAFCARDMQLNTIRRLDGWKLPKKKIFFPEYCWNNDDPIESEEKDNDEVHVVSIGTFCLEKNGQNDSGYLKLARMLTEQKIHLHIYPHWFYRQSKNSSFNWNLKEDFSDFFDLQKGNPYLHIHECLPLDDLMKVLPKYDFGLVSGGSDRLDQWLSILKRPYLDSCYSGRISDYLDARLPVLINSEVRFNCRMMKRYGVLIDLDQIFVDGFRESLLTVKKDPVVRDKVRKAAKALSLKENVQRLSDFYEDVAGENVLAAFRPGRLELALSQIPFIRRGTYRSTQLMDHLSESHTKNKMLVDELTSVKTEYADELASVRDELTSVRTEYADELISVKAEYAKEKSRWEDRYERDVGETKRINSELLQRFPAGEAFARRHQEEVDVAGKTPDELSGLLWWPEARDEIERENGFDGLLRMCGTFQFRASEFSQYSQAWTALSKKNFDQLLRDGFSNFKRTIATNYFTFLVQAGDPQIAALEEILSDMEIDACRNLALAEQDDLDVNIPDQFSYRYFVHLLWLYARKLDVNKNLERVTEPEIGNPYKVHQGRQIISQDLANSMIEYYSMAEVLDFKECNRILEIGAGYGRNAHVVMSLHPQVRYFFVDVPPSLYVAQKYLTMLFPDRPAFPVQDFESFSEVREAIEKASLVFLLPHQLKFMPDDFFDLSISISNLGEMTKLQIAEYASLIGRVTDGFAYNKQWESSINPFDNQVIDMSDYVAQDNWNEIYIRKCANNPEFFESMHKIGKPE